MTSWFYGVASGGGGGGGGGKKAQVNLNFFDPTLDFPFIDCSKNNSGFGPRGGTPTVDWYALLNADGYPTAIASGSSNWTLFASCYLLEANSSFTGSVTGTAMTVSGSVTGTALHVGQTVSGTGITAGTRIVSGSGTSWVLSQSMGATGSITITGFIPWVLTWSGTASVWAAGIGLTGINFPFPGVAIGSNRMEYNITNTASNPVGAPVNTEIVIDGITTTPSNIQFFRQDQETLLSGGQLTAPHFKTFYGPYGRLRFMNWQNTNGSMLSDYSARSQKTNIAWLGQNVRSAIYCGQCTQTKNDYTAPQTLTGSPVAWTQGMMVQASIVNNPAACTFTGSISGTALTVGSVQQGALAIGQALRSFNNNGSVTNCTITAGSGTSWTVSVSQTVSSQKILSYTGVTGFAVGATTTVTAPNHGFVNGDVVFFPAGEIASSGGSGIDNNLFGKFYTVSSAATNTFVLSGINSTGWGTYSSGGIVTYQVRVATSTLPFKQVVTNIVGSFYEGGQLDNMNTTPLTLVYDATFDKLMYAPDPRVGIPYEVACQMAVECNSNPCLCIPALATDAFVSSMATTIKAALSGTSLQWVCELSNEVWNTSGGFSQSNYAQQKGAALWGLSADLTRALANWYGWRFYNMMLQVDTVYTGVMSQVHRTFGFQTSFTDTTYTNYRLKASDSGVAAFPITLADSICIAPYLEPDRITTAQAVTIYNYKQGVATSNSALIASAFSDLDAAFDSPFAQYTGGISNGSGGAGTILNVTAVVAGTTIQVGAPVNYGGVAAATFVTALGTGTGGVGTYTVNNSQLVAPGATFYGATTFTGGSTGVMHVSIYPFWKNIAQTYSVGLCQYEGGWGVYPYVDNGGSSGSASGGSSAPLSYNPGGGPVSLSAADQFNLFNAYQQSSNYATKLTNALADFKSFGGVYASAYCVTSGSPNDHGMFGMQYPSAAGAAAIFGTAIPAKTSFDTYSNT